MLYNLPLILEAGSSVNDLPSAELVTYTVADWRSPIKQFDDGKKQHKDGGGRSFILHYYYSLKASI